MSRVMDGRRGFPAVVVAGAVVLGFVIAVPAPVSAAVRTDVSVPASVVLEAAPLLRSVAEEKVKDPAGESAPLPDTVADLPDDSVAVVDPVADWTRVPGSPLEVRVDPDATAEELTPVPAATGGEMRVVPAVASVGAEDPLALVDVAPVRVEVKRPDDLGASVMLVSLTDGSAAGELVTDRKAPPVEVRLDYGGFDELFGGSWGQRLQVLAFPECYLTSPELEECSQSTVVPFTKDIASRSVSFATLEAEKAVKEQAEAREKSEKDKAAGDAAGGGKTAEGGVVDGGADAGESGATGASFGGSPAGVMGALLPASNGGSIYSFTAGAGGYGASPFSQSSEWQVGEGSGEFSYSYDFVLPPAQGGAAPGLSLGYSSGGVDGMSLAENGQASSAGLGWELSTSYITRAYMSCAKDGEPTWGDLCWRTRASNEGLVEDLRIVLNGRASRLIPVSANSFRLQDDPGWKVERLRGTQGVDNADNDNEGFKVSTPDGSIYWFGYGNGSEGVATVSVYGNHAGEPCNGEPNDRCKQGWKWMLDRVYDPTGNRVEYEYEQEENSYGTKGSASNTLTYDRAVWLQQIRYGMNNAVTVSGGARQVVDVTSKLRCIGQLTDPAADCTGTNGPRAQPNQWPDVPADLLCDPGDSCDNSSPTFFSTRRYYQVKTSTVSIATTRNVDEYTLVHTLPDPDGPGGDQKDLWLDVIERTGKSPAGDVVMQPVTFDGVSLQNRVKVPSGDLTLKKFRIDNLVNEGGGAVDVVYGHKDGNTCTGSVYDSAHNRWNADDECYAQKYAALGDTPAWEWFHKYVVKTVTLSDAAVDQVAGPSGQPKPTRKRVYDYQYLGAPAWRLVNSRNTDSDEEIWADWRGYEKTIVHTRDVDVSGTVVTGDWSSRVVVRFRGMNNSKKNPAGDLNENVRIDTETIATAASEPLDNRQLNGRVAEVVVRDSAGASRSRTYHDYQTIDTLVIDYLPDAHMVVTERTDVYKFEGSSAGSLHRVTYDHDEGDAVHRSLNTGNLLATHDQGFVSTSAVPAPADGDEVCTKQTWTQGATAWLKRPSQTTVYGLPCTSTLTAADRVRQSTSLYDGQTTVGNTLTEGLLTRTNTVVDDTTTISTQSTYDVYGRPVTTLDGNGNTTSIAYNLPGAETDLLSQVRVTNPLGHVATTTVDPRRAQPTATTDANGGVTNLVYDGVGRLTEVRNPGVGAGSPASVKYHYGHSRTSPDWVSTETPRGDGGATWAFTYFDGWGREFQTQTQTGTGRMVQGRYYDERGNVWMSFDQQVTGTMSGPGVAPAVYVPTTASLPRLSETTYDALTRVTQVQDKALGVVKSTTTTTFGYETVTVDAPAPLGATRSTLDAYGRALKVELVDTVAPGSPTVDAADYVYNAAGDLTGMSKTVAGWGTTTGVRNWVYTYDLAGRKTTADDPDVGVTTYAYDANSNPTVVNPAANPAITTTYDALNRPTTRKNGSTTVSTWTYDTATLGVGLPRKTTHFTPKLDGSTGTDQVTSEATGYTALGAPTGVTSGFPGEWIGKTGAQTYQVGFTYNSDLTGRLISQSYPQVTNVTGGVILPAKTVSLEYGVNDMITKMATPEVTVAAVAYNNRNQPVTVSSGPGLNLADPSRTQAEMDTTLIRSYGWEADSARVDTITGTKQGTGVTTDLGLNYDYDAAGNPAAIYGTSGTSTSCWEFGYDPVGRLSTADTGLSVLDAGGVPSSCTETGTANTQVTGVEYKLAYGYKRDRLDTVSNGPSKVTLPTFVGSGNAPHAPRSTDLSGSTFPGAPTNGDMTYDGAGRLKTFTPVTGPVVTSTYDVLGNLWSTVGAGTVSGSNPTTHHAYDATGLRVARRVKTGTAATAWTSTVYLGAAELTYDAATTGLSARRHHSTPGGTPVAVEESTGVGGTPAWTWLLSDAQGNVRLTKAGTGTGAVAKYHYYPFGQPTTTTPPGERGYLNKTHDPSGDIRLDHRTYTPVWNTLTTPDPILAVSDPQSFNPYAYARNNPVAFADPTGLSCERGSGNPLADIAVRCHHDSPDAGSPEPDPGLNGSGQGSYGDNGSTQRSGASAPSQYCANVGAFGGSACGFNYTPGSVSAIGHGVLDVAGLVPGLGEPADLLNAAWYAATGDEVMAGLSAAAAVPGIGWGATGAKVGIRAAGAAKYGDEVVEGIGDARTYIDLTKGGSIRNVGTNATHTEFADNLAVGGWISRTSNDGAVQIFQRGGAKYVLRERAGSYGGWTADFTPAGAQDVTLKIRLGYMP